jgi:ABC-type transport system involved in multi-copper enzyme maturation permease subunit
MLTLPLANLELWLTPLWMLSLGVTLGVAILAALWGLFWLVNRDAAAQAATAIGESVLIWLVYLAAAMVLLAFVAGPTMPLQAVRESLVRLPSVGTTSLSIELPPQTEDQPLAVDFVAEEVTSYTIASDQDVRVASDKGLAYTAPAAVVIGDEPYVWTTKSKYPRGFNGRVSEVFLTNDGDSPAKVELTFQSAVRTPEVAKVPITAAFVVGTFLAYLGLRWLSPNLANIAAATAKDAVGQPMYLLFLIGGAIALVVYVYIPYNTFGEDVKMLKDSGLSTIMILAIVFAMWTASVTIADEIEGKTALTLLSKPVSRWQFIVGKYVGILWPVLLMFVVLGTVLLATVSYKVVYDARETSNPTPDWQLCHSEMVSTVPGLVLAFFETAVLTAISVAVSTRLPMLPNLLIVGSIYVLGHLTPLVVQSSVGKNEFVAFFGRLVASVLPMLDHLNIQPAIAAGQAVPWAYLGWAGVYSLLYIVVSMLLALVLFEDRDLA